MAVNRNSVIGRLPDPPIAFPLELTPEELAAIQAKLHLRIYEPVVIPSELLFTVDGDIIMAWGGDYAS